MHKFTLPLLLFLITSCSEFNNSELANIDTKLTSLEVASESLIFYPEFNPQVFHYAANCGDGNNIQIVAQSEDSNQISINHSLPEDGYKSQDLSGLSEENDIYIKVKNGKFESNYFVHCVDSSFPEINITYRDDSYLDYGFMLISPRFKLDNQTITYLLIIDSNGVPRFRRKLDSIATDFKVHLNGYYSYVERTVRNDFNHWDNDIVILNNEFNEVTRLNAVGLNHTDGHDFLITKEDTFIIMSYNSIYRDMSEFGLSENELTRDSVIQEITDQGEILMEWNSWDALDINDCKQHRWPDDYAHINSINVSEDNNIILSLRGCSQALKIDRSSGQTIWQLNGSNPSLIITGDPYKEFCGQHTISEIDGYLYIFDNGGYCLGDREENVGQFSRALKYKLDYDQGYAEFVSDYSQNNAYSEYTSSGGSFFLTPRGNWIINWAKRSGDLPTIDEVSLNGDLALSIVLKKGEVNARTYRAYKERNLWLPVNTGANKFFYYTY